LWANAVERKCTNECRSNLADDRIGGGRGGFVVQPSHSTRRFYARGLESGAVNAMLLNEFLKEHAKGEEQECRLARQEALIAQQQKQIQALTAGLQKVTARLELHERDQRVVSDQ